MGRAVRKKAYSRALPGRHDAAAEPAPDACAARCARLAPALLAALAILLVTLYMVRVESSFLAALPTSSLLSVDGAPAAAARAVVPPQPLAPSPPPPPPPPPPRTYPPGTWEDFDDPLWPGWRNQAPPDAWTAALAPPSAESIGFTGRTPKAYILTVNTSSYRYRYTAVRAAASGMLPVPHIGSWPPSDTVRPLGMRKLCGTRFAHKTSWMRFVEDAGAGEQDWAFFFEDDVNIAPPLRGPTVHHLWRTALAHPDVAARGIVYLGYCAATRVPGTNASVLVGAEEPLPALGGAALGVDVLMDLACGSCQHAYGLRKDFARRFWAMGELNIPHQDDACNTTHAEARGRGYRAWADPAQQGWRGGDVVNADTSAIYVCMKQLGGFPSVAFNIPSPQNVMQVGPFFQDRHSFASTLDASNYGVGTSETHLKSSPTLEDARRQR